jgi:hypothetical protein
MFSFFHRTPKITVDCFTYSPSVYEYAPVVRAIRAVPDFWKALPNPDPYSGFNDDGTLFVRRDSTLKNCLGFIELYKRGFIIENWSAIHLFVEQEGFRFYNADLDMPQSHPKSQLGEGFKYFHHLKLISPWLLREKTGVNFVCIPTTWSHEKYDFAMPSGVLDFKLNHAVNINIMLRIYQQPYETTIEFGHPLVHFIPLSEHHLEVKNHLVDQLEYDKLKIHPANSFMGWRRIHKLVRRNEERNNGKCPFGFGE